MYMLPQEPPENDLDENWDKKEKLGWLMDTYGDRIIRLAYTYVRSEQVAEDVAQEVFLKCYEKMESFRGESSYKTWLYKITVNKCKDHLKSWANIHLQFTDAMERLQKNTTPSAGSEYLLKNENEEIANELLSLPVKYREVLILYYYEHLSLNETSVLLKSNLNTVKSRLTRGRKLLAKKLEGWDHYEKRT